MLIEELLHYKSCSVVGLEKNTGKTVCLNYLLQHLPQTTRVAVTSIGLDGERRDQVTGTHKPEITLRRDTLFATSEKHYRQRRLVSELTDITDIPTALGRLITARVLIEGQVILSGAPSTADLRRWMDSVENKVDLILVDGALSRMSLASPAISQSMILATGAAYSANIDTLVRKTKYLVSLIQLPLYQETAHHDEEQLIRIHGAVTDRVLEQILNDPSARSKELVIQDFTRVFADEMLWHRFTRQHAVSQMQRSQLLAITVNPIAPNGMTLDSELLCARMSEAVNLPVYDLMKINTVP